MAHPDTDVPDQPDDLELMDAVRHGRFGAFGELYRRHRRAAVRVAAYLPASAGDPEDVVAEAFARVLRRLRDGAGPWDSFRAYLLVTVRNVAVELARKESQSSPHEDVPERPIELLPEEQVLKHLNSAAAMQALAELPERWRLVLWQTEVEGKTHTAIGDSLGLAPNSVAALAYRAREGLRHAYLRRHLPPVLDRRCQHIAHKLPAWVRRQLSEPKRQVVNAHLDECPECRQIAADLAVVNEEFHGNLAAVLLATQVSWLSTSASVGAGASHSLGAITNTLYLGKACKATAAFVLAATAAVPGSALVPDSSPRYPRAFSVVETPTRTATMPHTPSQAPPPRDPSAGTSRGPARPPRPTGEAHVDHDVPPLRPVPIDLPESVPRLPATPATRGITPSLPNQSPGTTPPANTNVTTPGAQVSPEHLPSTPPADNLAPAAQPRSPGDIEPGRLMRPSPLEARRAVR